MNLQKYLYITKAKRFIKNNLMKTYKIRYGSKNIKENDLINLLFSNLFIMHNDLNYYFDYKLYNINSLFPKYGSANYYELNFNSCGSIFNITLYAENYFITIFNEQFYF
jgi:hypothetical protein